MPSVVNEAVARKLLPIIYVIDTSGSMIGDRIASVNEAMNDSVEVLKDVSENNPTAELKIGVMQFDSNVRWVTNGLVFLEDYYWNDLSAGGLTSLGAALDELNEKLSRKELLSSDVGYKAPVIIFMSDGYPTDDYIKSLKKVRDGNKWFKIATKIAIGVGDDFDKAALTDVVGNSEAVIQVNDNETLKKLIRVVSVTASMVGSKSRTDESQINEVLAEVRQEMQGEADIDIPDPVTPPAQPQPKKDPDDAWDTGGGWGDSSEWT
ncbi:MAG: VWA domain-containing protein [Lachnospiraceae bacterium]|nr:VWA domain-containing protein [Lachnospiraceae bacterium]